MPQRIAVIGTGLIGGSVGLALTRRGCDVVGHDRDPGRLRRAKELGAVASIEDDLGRALDGADVAVVAVPVGHIAAVVAAALDAGVPLVTDVGSVKAPIVAELEARPGGARRFVGGHPMAGSEQEGVDGADADLFVGATWVLTPTTATDEDAYTQLRALVRDMGAEVVTVTPEHHDVVVALVSHAPQLAASTLMDVANDQEEEHQVLLRLAAGGFRDMTRIAAGHPAIWPDILAANRDAVVDALDRYLESLRATRDAVARGDREFLLALLERARAARRNLPVGVSAATDLVELRVPVPDRPGVFAEVTTLAGRLGVNLEDFEVAHSLEGAAGVAVLVVAASDAPALEAGLHELGYHTSSSRVER
ncbi:MAG: prephenate dehydrogenase [Actinomycetota bacterium]|nr:prephenate dehydrogenase [Actinomycetota bacterium]